LHRKWAWRVAGLEGAVDVEADEDHPRHPA
jgi:hypothetical protein